MSLPSLLRFVYNHGSGQVITRGKKIFFARGVSILDIDYHIEQVRFRVRNDVYNNFYTVTVSKFLQPESVSVRCQCPYNLGEICRHEVAAMFHLNDLVLSGFFENTQVQYDQKHTVVRMRDINLPLLRLFTNEQMMADATQIAAGKKSKISFAKNEKVIAKVPDGKGFREVSLLQNEDRYFDSSCECDETAYPVCIHKLSLFIELHNEHGTQYFRTLQNWDDQKNKLLRLYGYSLNDDLEGKFDFIYENGKPCLRVLDSSIKKVSATIPIAPTPLVDVVSDDVEEHSIGLVIDTQTDWYPHSGIELIIGETDEAKENFIDKIQRLALEKYLNVDAFEPIEQEWIALARKAQPEEIVKYLKKSLPFGDFIGDYHSVLKDHLDPELFTPLWEYLLPKYKSLLQKGDSSARCFIRWQGKAFTKDTLSPIKLSIAPATPFLNVEKNGNKYTIKLSWNIAEEVFAFEEVTMINAALILHKNTLFSANSVAEIGIVETFLPSGNLQINAKEWNLFLEEKLVKWRATIDIHFSENLVSLIENSPVAYNLYLYEQNESLHLKPSFVYHEIEAKLGEATQIIKAIDGKVSIIERDTVSETAFCNMLQKLHENMLYSMREKHFYIHSKNVMKSNWYHHKQQLYQVSH